MAALAPLATPADLPQGASGNVTRALKVASAAVRDAAGCPISVTTATVKTNGGPENLLQLPGPVRDVASVVLDGETITDFIPQANGLWRACGWGGAPIEVQVTYTFGLTIVPDDIVDLVAQLAVSWLQHQAAGGGSVAGLKSVRIDDASESYTDEAGGQVSPVFIPENTRAWLAARFGAGVEVVSFL